MSSLWGIFFAAMFLLQSNLASTLSLVDLAIFIFLVAMLQPSTPVHPRRGDLAR